jgi:hypothetical protein
MTPAELVRLPDRGRGVELIDGVPVERVGSMLASYVSGKLLRRLMGDGDERFPIWVACSYPFACIPKRPDTVRRPSVVGVLNLRMAAWPDDTDDPCTIVPDIVAEVVSRTRPAEDAERRCGEWLAAGVREVWVVEPPTRTVHAYRADGGYAFLREADTLTTPVLPGFLCPVADLFRRPGGAAPAAGDRPA